MPETGKPAATSYALLVLPDGMFKVIDWPANSGETLKTLRTEIECSMVDVVDITPNLSMWIDDEGLYSENPYVNVAASYLFSRYATPHQPYLGNAVFTGGTDKDGDTLGLSEDQTLELVQHLLTIIA
ncbi:DUF3846 domain-containing protein [Streptomyces sp. NPDC055815]